MRSALEKLETRRANARVGGERRIASPYAYAATAFQGFRQTEEIVGGELPMGGAPSDADGMEMGVS